MVTSAMLGTLRTDPHVARVVSYYDTDNPDFVSSDRRATYVAVALNEPGSTKQLDLIRGKLAARGLRTQVGGATGVLADVNMQVSADAARAEVLAMPVLFILMLVVFRGLIAALTPLLVGGLAILGALTFTRMLTWVTEVSVFALNMITLLGLGMAIDYSLFVVSRFREELAAGHPVPEALGRTVRTAGRTVAVSGCVVALALAGLLLFPQVFLRSLGFGGMAAVLIAMISSLTVLPALLAVLGTRINALPVRMSRRYVGSHGARDRAAHRAAPREGDGWDRIARGVMLRPVMVTVVVATVLVVLALPFARVRFGGVDANVLPAGRESRVVSERIRDEFRAGGADQITVLVSSADSPAAASFARRIAGLPHVTAAAVVAHNANSWLVAVSYDGDYGGPIARGIVAQIRAQPPPGGGHVLVGGAAAEVSDLMASIGRRLPWMALLMVGVTMILLFLAFGSVLLPVKAVLMNVVSIGASFGAVVWIFQEGHLKDVLQFTPTGYLEATQPIIMLAILFGLSTDYEVFLLSRIREEWDRTGVNTAAVTAGMARTGRIITSAAVLLIVVVSGFSTSGITFVKMVGVGMIVAILVDATIVRALLVPATMRLLGRANWWAPPALRQIHQRYGISESEPLTSVIQAVPITAGSTAADLCQQCLRRGHEAGPTQRPGSSETLIADGARRRSRTGPLVGQGSFQRPERPLHGPLGRL